VPPKEIASPRARPPVKSLTSSPLSASNGNLSIVGLRLYVLISYRYPTTGASRLMAPAMQPLDEWRCARPNLLAVWCHKDANWNSGRPHQGTRVISAEKPRDRLGSADWRPFSPTVDLHLMISECMRAIAAVAIGLQAAIGELSVVPADLKVPFPFSGGAVHARSFPDAAWLIVGSSASERQRRGGRQRKRRISSPSIHRVRAPIGHAHE